MLAARALRAGGRVVHLRPEDGDAPVLLACEMARPQKPNWCWVSVARSAAAYLGGASMTPCALATRVLADPPPNGCGAAPPAPVEDCCASGACDRGVADMEAPLRVLGVDAGHLDAPLADRPLRDALAHGAPVVAGISWGAADPCVPGHAVLVVGHRVEEGLSLIAVLDPDLGEPGSDRITLTEHTRGALAGTYRALSGYWIRSWPTRRADADAAG